MSSKIKWQWSKFDELTPVEMHSIFELRQSVFIIEQDCIYPDIDGKDDQAFHLMGWLDGQLVATLRVFEEYEDYQTDAGQSCASIGRICTHTNFRESGTGQKLVAQAISFITSKFNRKPIKIGAQFYLKRFYERFGFKQVSDIYDEDGIDHIYMLLCP